MVSEERRHPEQIPWWYPPQLSGERRMLAARLLHWLLLLSIGLIGVLMVAYAQRPYYRGFNLRLLLGMAGVFLLAWFGLRRGAVRLASWTYLAAMVIVPTYLVARFGGLYSSYLALYTLLPLLASILLGWRYTVGFTLFAVCSLSVFWVFSPNTISANIPAEALNLDLVTWSVYASVYIISASVIIYAVRIINHIMTRLQNSEQALAGRNADLQAQVAAHAETAARLQQIFDNTPLAILTLNPDRTLCEVNPRAREVFDIMDTANGPAFRTQRLHAEDDLKHTRLFASLFAEEADVLRTESRLNALDGTQRIIHVTLARVDVETAASYVLALIEDVTEARAAAQRQLELELAHERNAFLQEFISQMTHDLKNPLTIINTSLYLMRQKIQNPHVEHYADRIEAQVAHQHHMIEEILTLAQLDQMPTLERTAVNINELLRDIGESQRPQIVRQGQVLSYELDQSLPTAALDQEKLVRALTNLVNNAVKYTPTGGRITLRTALEANWLAVAVLDTGIGIDPSALPHIFERFYRTDAARSGYHGTGLGLSIVQQIVNLHGGEVHITSKPGAGTTVRLLLPLAPSA